MLDAEAGVIAMLQTRLPALSGQVSGFGARPGELGGRQIYATVLITSASLRGPAFRTLGRQTIAWAVTLRGQEQAVRDAAYALPDALRGWYSDRNLTIRDTMMTAMRPPVETAGGIAEARLTFDSEIGA